MGGPGDREGLFVVLEGIDGSGTTTQARMLGLAIAATRPCLVTREPSDGPLGEQIRRMLRSRLVMPGGGAPWWKTVALLFAADRMDHLECEILPAIARGEVVISDRYEYSSFAYQTVTSDEPGTGEWIRAVHRYARRPDLVIVLDVPAEEAARRRASRGQAAEIFERSEVQRRCAEVYARLGEAYPGDSIVHVDGSMGVGEVHEAILEAVQRMLARKGQEGIPA